MMTNFACIRSGSGPHTLSTLCFKPCMENESELALGMVLGINQEWKLDLSGEQPQPKSMVSWVDVGPDCSLKHTVLLGPHSSASVTSFRLPVVGWVWRKCLFCPMGHCRHRSSSRKDLMPSYLLHMDWASKAEWIYGDGCCRKDAGINALCSIMTPSFPLTLSLTKVYISVSEQRLCPGCIVSLGPYSKWNADVLNFVLRLFLNIPKYSKQNF